MSNKYLLKTQINHLEYIIFTGDRTLWFLKWSHSCLWVISPDRTLGQGNCADRSSSPAHCGSQGPPSRNWCGGVGLYLAQGPCGRTAQQCPWGHSATWLFGKIDWLRIFLQFWKPRAIDMDQTPAFSFSIWNGNTLCSSASSRFFRIEGVSLSLLLFISEHKWRHVVMGVWEGIAGCCWRIRKVDLTVSVVLALLCSLWCFLLCSGQFLESTCFLWLCQAPAF